MATPTRRSTRVSKAPDRLAPVTAQPPPNLTPRKRSKEAGVQAKEPPSAFAMPLVASSGSKRQRTSNSSSNKSKQPPRSRITEATSDDEDSGADEDQDDEVSEAAGSSSSEEDDEVSDFEEPRPKTPLLKTPQRRRGQKEKKTRKSAKKSTGLAASGAASGVAHGEASQLLNAIIDDDVALAQVVIDWISSYREGSDHAVCELINFFIKLTGCPGSISEDALYESEAIGSVLDGLQKQSLSALKQGGGGTEGAVEVDGGDDLLLGKSKEHRKFRKNALL
ncbi:cohesin complex subunit, partial [Coemansia erecta]